MLPPGVPNEHISSLAERYELVCTSKHDIWLCILSFIAPWGTVEPREIQSGQVWEFANHRRCEMDQSLLEESDEPARSKM